MAAEERDDAESTEGGTPHVEPAPDQFDTARLEPERPDAAQPEPPAPPVGAGGTAVMPPVPGGPPPAPEQPRWAARAQVPTPQVEEYGDEWVGEPPRRVLVPVLLTVCVMLLLGVVGAGVWLALSGDGPGGVSPSPTATNSPTAPATTSSSPPPPTTTSSTPAGIPVPNVLGEEYEVAAQTLAGLGLDPERVDRFSNTVPAGRVIATDPTAASTLAPGETILVFVSLGPEPTASPSASPTASPTATEGEGD